MELEKLEIYNISMLLGEKVWTMVLGWKYFEKDTIGKQLVRSADSISANISEGFGRFYFNDSKHFFYYARGSLYETKTWIYKAYQRNLLTENEFEEISTQINILGIKLNKFIKSIGSKN